MPLESATLEPVSYAYGGLTRACHHHSYELSPTAGEITGWLDDVGALTEMLDAAGPS